MAHKNLCPFKLSLSLSLQRCIHSWVFQSDLLDISILESLFNHALASFLRLRSVRSQDSVKRMEINNLLNSKVLFLKLHNKKP